MLTDYRRWDCWQCQTAVTPILTQSGSPVLFWPQGIRRGVGRVRGSVVLLAVGTDHTFRACGVLRLVFRILSHCWGRTGRLRRTVRNPLRSDRFPLLGWTAYQLNVTVRNSEVYLNGGLLAQVTARIHAVNGVVLRLFSL
jgi:hypothetical protein